MAGKRKTSNEWEGGNSLKKRKTDRSEHEALLFTDLSDLLQLLTRHGYSEDRYYRLSLFLGLSPNTISVIEADHRGDTGRCLSDCLTKWLQKADDVVKKGGPTIYSLVSALRELGENGVADGIDMEKHPACKILAHCASDRSLLALLPQLTALLCLEKLIKEILLATNVQGEDLLTQIKEAVCNDYRKLKAFAEILHKFKVTASLGNAIMKEYRVVYCIDDLMKVNDNTNVEGLKIFLPLNVTLEFKKMRLTLGQTFFKVGSIMMSSPQSPTLDNIKYVLGAYDKALRPQVAQCEDIHSILQLVCDSCPLDDISVLEYFINEFNIEEAKDAIQKYKKAIKELKETKLSQCLNETISHASPLECERITIFVDEDANQSVLNDVKRLSSALFKNFSRHVKLNVVQDGNSFTITCSFPLILSEQLITAALNNIDVLKENKVKRLTIGYCTVYEVKDTSTATTTEIDEYTSSLSTSSGLMKQLMLSLSVQLINRTEEVTTLNEESITMKKEVESLKETLDAKNKMLSASIAESERFKRIAAETKQLLEEKVSHLTEREEENENLKEIKKILEQQLALFQSEKEDLVEKIEETQMDTVLHQEENEAKSKEEIEMLQMKITTMHSQRIEMDKKVQEKEELLILQIRKLEEELLQEKITTMNLQQIEKDKLVQGQEINPLIFQDDVYGDIVIDHPLIIKIVKTRQFQRLKDIKQLGKLDINFLTFACTIGYTYHIMPKANYSRFQHSIGMYFLAGEYVKQLQRKQPELNITESDVLCVQIAALCFNLGHGPFSYTFDMLLDEMSATTDFNKPWKNVPEVSVKMFEYMHNNRDLMASFEEYKLTTEDITFIKELIQGVNFEQRKDKRFLYEIVVNKKSGLDVSMIDSTVRDAAVLGKNVTFRWRVFLSKVRVLRCADGESHICFQKDDLETYNDLFRTRHTLFRELYYLRKNRIAALMIKRILAKSNDIPIIRYEDRRVTLPEATQSMLAYSQLNDGILSVIKILVDDHEVQELLSCLDSMKVIGQIGHIQPTTEWNVDRIKQYIEGSIKPDNIAGHLIIDPIKSGYENHVSLSQYYYTGDGSTGQWTHEWAQPTQDASKSKIRMFLVSGDRDLIHEVQKALQKLITDEQLDGDIYPDQDNDNLMPPL
ncbi:PREDICTED: uncharacterized protein LOC109586329 isoform X1 [Amphimedon queenslandica]|uniref:Death domain-containing protein n=1 Tax=Amphimedon queenslandica TaxID=400682 RepID=A0AAN0JMM4_AMPQE|nr:PREDICTED: uncharacterized protein LOC109586329 isoform X1 [Amphimedon queenslandica]|eukprot:XP_019858068.1 PREDICTED: uncharacterized protein LOC109586329 isoform X1 [Amphimedon queenslandica]